MRIVVTGATGLIGRHLVPALAAGHEVWALHRGATPAPQPRVTWLAADLAAPALPALLPPQADVVVHLAQSMRYREWPDQAMDVFNVNIASTVRLLDWSRQAGVGQFVLASSGAVAAPPQPPSFYVASRQSAELLAGAYAEAFRLLVARFYFVYGPGQPRSMFIPRLIDTIKAGGAVTLAGADGPRFNPVHVDDAAAALVAAIHQGASGVLPVAGADALTIREIADTIGRELPAPVRFVMDAAQQPQDLIGDITRMTGLLGRPPRTFAAGVRELLRVAG